MPSLTKEQNKNLPQIDAARERPPLATRLAFEIPKPLDWQTFQRQCVVLFIEELGDPNTQEYGRHGQAQGGIDILVAAVDDRIISLAFNVADTISR